MTITQRVVTTRRQEWILITDRVNEAVRASGVESGLCLVFCPHTTAAITINENADPDVVHDLTRALDRAYPQQPDFRHAEGNSAAHAKALAVGADVVMPVEEGRLRLGTWQGVYFAEFDGPRHREIWIRVLGG